MKTLVLPMVVAMFLGCAATPPIAEVPVAHDDAAPIAEVLVDDDAPPSAFLPAAAATPVADVPAPAEKKALSSRLSVADAVKGEAAWTKEGCSSCHHGGTADASEKRPFLAGVHNPLDSDEQVQRAMRAVREGVNGRLSMPAHPHLDEATLLDLLSYARSLK